VTTPDRWNRIEEIYHAALARPTDLRAAFIREACGDDVALCMDVESLLAQDASAASFLETPAAARSLAPGTRIGPYEIVSLLGAGGMGVVYKARDTRLPRTVAIKLLPPAFSEHPDRLRRFEQEARAAAALNHPNILALYDVGTYEQSPYLVSELLDGDTLRKRLAGGPLPVRKAVDYAIQIARGMAAAHEKDIVHRDLKPDNIFITSDGHVKILDFGLAKLVEEAAPAEASQLLTVPAPEIHRPQTTPGMVMGTVGYMSPEQVQGAPADPRSDIFAFGAILYEMLGGRRAFGGDTAIESMMAILKEDPAPLPASGRNIPPALERLVDRCLEKKAASRFQTASDLAFALETLSSSQIAMESVPPPIAQTSRSRRWSPILVSVSSIGAAALSVLAVWIWTNRPASDSHVYRSTLIPPVQLGGGTTARNRFSLSPDGRTLAFTAVADATPQLWVRSLDGLTAQPLPGTDGAVAPFWSPDSKSIAFVADGKLKKIDAAGGPVITLADSAATVPGSWNADNVILFMHSSTEPLFRVSGAGGAATPATTLDTKQGETFNGFPFFLPDGRHFLFTAGRRLTVARLLQPDGAVLYVGSLDSSQRTRVLEGVVNAKYAMGFLLFMRGTTLMAQRFDPDRFVLSGDASPIGEQIQLDQTRSGAFSPSQTGALVYQTGSAGSRLTWFDRTGHELGSLGDPADYNDLFLSRDGSRATVSVADTPGAARDDWIVDVKRGIRNRFTFDAADEHEAIWSPDSAEIIFNSNRKGPMDLFIKHSSGAGSEELLLADEFDKFPQSWSPDGRFIMYIRQRGMERALSPRGNSQELWVLPLSGDRKPFPFAQTEANERFAQFSPDGRWVAYQSLEFGRGEVYVAPFPGPGGKRQVSSGGGTSPRWRGDGKEIFFESPGRRVMAATVAAHGDSFEVSQVQPLFTLRRGGTFWNWDVTPDGQRFLVNAVREDIESAPMTLVVNWVAGLKK
jgi:serine/threonine protein kinase/Tol biopolymer transport system component